MNIPLVEQIDAQEKLIAHMEATLPESIARNRITVYRAEQRVAVARAILQSLIQIKRLYQGEVPHV
ncbi:MAG: hypothetical protein V4633_13395 [Pseudomonadota bacterium]